MTANRFQSSVFLIRRRFRRFNFYHFRRGQLLCNFINIQTHTTNTTLNRNLRLTWTLSALMITTVHVQLVHGAKSLTWVWQSNLNLSRAFPNCWFLVVFCFPIICSQTFVANIICFPILQQTKHLHHNILYTQATVMKIVLKERPFYHIKPESQCKKNCLHRAHGVREFHTVTVPVLWYSYGIRNNHGGN